MSDSFEAVTGALWRSLGLVPPGTERPALQIDGRTVDLAPGPDGTQVVISASLGRLADGGARRTEQLRRLLRDGLGLLLTNQAGLRLTAGSDAQVEAVTTAPCRLDAAPLLRGRIEEVLHLLELHAATLEADPFAGTHAPMSLGETMLLRL
ncbi:hypothetical protein [uncultured Methylobacterium sp.]|uniref:hypothetical protein n=1 Tax=uncultured Methylobacterium sp. TaxID=157278 RepID=UPI0035CA8C52